MTLIEIVGFQFFTDSNDETENNECSDQFDEECSYVFIHISLKNLLRCGIKMLTKKLTKLCKNMTKYA
ncbi:hypothetical protein ABF87_06345 [Nitrosomonas sp. JL21]|nr:hypothetical protein [Nitrosomonas sp. JL21]